MYYIIFQLGSYQGAVRVMHLPDELLLFKMKLDCNACSYPPPKNAAEALACFKATAFELQSFPTLEDAETWACTYHGFRAEEVRAELRRYRERLAGRAAGIVAA